MTTSKPYTVAVLVAVLGVSNAAWLKIGTCQVEVNQDSPDSISTDCLVNGVNVTKLDERVRSLEEILSRQFAPTPPLPPTQPPTPPEPRGPPSMPPANPPCVGKRMVTTKHHSEGGQSGCHCDGTFYNTGERAGDSFDAIRSSFISECLADSSCNAYYYGSPNNGAIASDGTGAYGALCTAPTISTNVCAYEYLIDVKCDCGTPNPGTWVSDCPYEPQP